MPAAALNGPSSTTRIEVAGATGRVGRRLIGLLARNPVEIVPLTLHAQDAKIPGDIALAAIAFDRPDTIRQALRGIDRLFIRTARHHSKDGARGGLK